jgi:23S rRNA pseudouridine1911/1915/1917 synthase
VYDDHDVVVVDKPAGLVVHPGAGHGQGTLVQGLLALYPDMGAVGDPTRPGVVHRLDKGTSGLLVFARTAAAYASLSRQLADRTADRRYRVLAWGHLDATRGLVDAPLGRGQSDRTRIVVTRTGRPARTRFEVERYYRDPEVTLLRCRLETGRTHQIRVHLAAVGHPVVGDSRYGGARRGLSIGRPFLHAEELGFDHPTTGERLSFTSALPADLEELLDRLR